MELATAGDRERGGREVQGVPTSDMFWLARRASMFRSGTEARSWMCMVAVPLPSKVAVVVCRLVAYVRG